MHIKGLLPDVTKLVDHIKEKNRMNNSELTKTKNFNATFWYTYPPQKHKIVRPSDAMEEAYATLGDWYLSHQKFIFEDPDDFTFSDNEGDQLPEDSDNLFCEYHILLMY